MRRSTRPVGLILGIVALLAGSGLVGCNSETSQTAPPPPASTPSTPPPADKAAGGPTHSNAAQDSARGGTAPK